MRGVGRTVSIWCGTIREHFRDDGHPPVTYFHATSYSDFVTPNDAFKNICV